MPENFTTGAPPNPAAVSGGLHRGAVATGMADVIQGNTWMSRDGQRADVADCLQVSQILLDRAIRAFDAVGSFPLLCRPPAAPRVDSRGCSGAGLIAIGAAGGVQLQRTTVFQVATLTGVSPSSLDNTSFHLAV